MAFPAVESTATTGRTAAETTSPVLHPAIVSAGALLVCIARCAVAGAIGWPSGWVEIAEDTSDASDDVTAIAYKVADGTEDGTTFNVTHGSGKSAYIVYSITGAADPAVQAPQLSAVAVGTSALPDPAANTPTGGAKDYLWLWLGAWEGEQTSPPAGNPTNYSSPLGASSGTGGVVATNVRCASAQRNLNAASENPPSWTISVSDDWTAWCMAVHPAITDRRSQVAWSEIELPNEPRRAQSSWSEFEVPNEPRRSQASWGELETPSEPRRAQSSFSEIETPDAPRRAQASFSELEVPDFSTDRRAQSSWSEFQIPDSPRRVLASWAELELPPEPRRATSSWAEFEAPSEPRRATVSWSEAEFPNQPPTYASYGGPFYYDSANWGSVAFYLEVYMRATSGEVFARLWNDTDSQAVSGSTVSTTNGAMTRVRSSALTLTSGKSYRVQFGRIPADSGEFVGAKVVAV